MDSGGGGNQTVTQSQQIPAYEQEFSAGNLNLAQSLAANPYPQYQGQLVAPLTGLQNQGIGAATQAAGSYQPDIANSEALASRSTGYDPSNAAQVGQYMSPYIQDALAPQIAGLQAQMGAQQRSTDAQATQANAFGDARHGVQSALNNFYGNQNLVGLLGSGYNSAFQNAQTQMLGQRSADIQGASAFSGLAGQQQGLGITGANALYNAGQQQQTQQQTGLNTAYQQFLNQTNWPIQMLNVREGALANNPYNTLNNVTVPGPNGTATGIGQFAQLAGGLGSLLSSGSGGGGARAPFGGAALNG